MKFKSFAIACFAAFFVILCFGVLYAQTEQSDLSIRLTTIRVQVAKQTVSIHIKIGLTGAIVAADVISSTAKATIILPDLTKDAHEIDGRNQPGERVHVAGVVVNTSSYIVPAAEPDRYGANVKMSNGQIVSIELAQELETGQKVIIYGQYAGKVTHYSGDKKTVNDNVIADWVR